MVLTVINQEFGDNDASEDRVWDPVELGAVDPEVTAAIQGLVGTGDTITNINNIFNTVNIFNSASVNREIPNFFKLYGTGDGDSDNLKGVGTSLQENPDVGPSSGISDTLPQIQIATDSSEGSGEVAAMSLSQAVTQFATGEAEGEGIEETRKGQGAEGQGAGAGGDAALGEDQTPKTQRKRGLLLQPVIDGLAGNVDDLKSSSTLLKNLSEGSVLGTNLLDALALGAGVLYVLYAPKAVETGKKGFRGLVNRVLKRDGMNATLAEQNVLSVFVMKMPNGTERVMAAKVGMSGIDVVAQQDLPADVSVEGAGNQTQVDYAVKQLLNKVGDYNADLLLLGSKLKGQAPLLQSLSKQTQLLETQGLTSNLSSCSATELELLENWLNKPSSTPPESSPVYQQMMEQISRYTGSLPAEQANMAGLIELSVAMAWTKRNNQDD